MKKRTISLLGYILALTLVMYNCKKKEEPFPIAPPQELINEMNAISLATVTPTQPAAVTTTPATFTASAKTTELAGALGGIAASGTVPASVQASAGEVTAALSTAEVNSLAAVTPATISAVAAGGAVPAELKAVLDKAAANPALQAYMPAFTLPTVNGTAVNGGRDGVSEGVEKTEGLEVEDACIDAANAAFNSKKTQLDTQRDQQRATVNTAYTNATQPLAAEQTACTAGVPATYNAYRQSGQAQATQALADIEAAQTTLGPLYPVLKALVNLQLLGYLQSVNTLQSAAVNACTATTTAKTAAAQAARDADLATITANYNTALAAAEAKRTELVASCHNQGGGN
ncbi:hypothetical protein GCM10027275_46430 [Rhabdobacter roseus]|uniref:Uncharacterized protein n=1 Tax=Rhabdobacter roseus TaxID=1655419 RepID=A0A840TYQ9_9BACT|nr:hypothetical protein [Rhabdobacter roseus]MBB5286687.1 hypothetical protein [Rhabdobacter roseus]